MAAKLGRPPLYETPEEMQKAIDSYFEWCKGKALTDPDGLPVFNKFGERVIEDAHPPTVTGLALALGFASRQALLNYQARSNAFNDTLMRAKSRIEAYAEERLYDKDGVQGAKFSLTNNFRGWSEKQDVNVSGEAVKIINNIPRGEKA